MLIHPQTKLIREPRLMVPRLRPVGPVKIHRGNVFGSLARFCFAPSSGLVDLGNGVSFLRVSGGTERITQAKLFITDADASAGIYDNYTKHWLPNPDRFSVMVVFDCVASTATAGEQSVFGWRDADNSSFAGKINIRLVQATGTGISFITNSGSSSDCQIAGSVLPDIVGSSSVIAIGTFDVNSRAVLYASTDSINVSTITDSTVSSWVYDAGASDHVFIGSRVGSVPLNGSIHLAAAFDAVLNEGQARNLLADPYQFLIPT